MSLLVDGFQTLVDFQVQYNGQNLSFLMQEREVQPPAMEVGKIDTTTMRTQVVRTASSKSLITIDVLTMHVQYDPVAYAALGPQGAFPLLGLLGLVTVYFPDGSSWENFGWMDKFTPTSHKEGEFPTAELKVDWRNKNNAGLQLGIGVYRANPVRPAALGPIPPMTRPIKF